MSNNTDNNEVKIDVSFIQDHVARGSAAETLEFIKSLKSNSETNKKLEAKIIELGL